jgi:cytochrome P450
MAAEPDFCPMPSVSHLAHEFKGEISREQVVATARLLLGKAAEEMLRFCTVAHIGRRRVVREDLTLASATIHAGEGIKLRQQIIQRVHHPEERA